MLPRQLLLPSLLLVGMPSFVSAQAPSPGSSSPANPGAVTRISDPYTPIYNNLHRYRSRTAPLSHSDPDADYGYRNPGGIGRVAEYYPPGNTFEQGKDPVVVAQFDQGPAATSRAAQMQAQSLGIQRTRTLNQHIDAYGRPLGFGYGGGFGFGYRMFPY